MAKITIIGAGMMGSALAFPARENGHNVALVGTHLDREIIETSKKKRRHPKFHRDFPRGIEYHQIEEVDNAISGADLVIGGVSSFGVDWFGDTILPRIPDGTPVLTVTKGLIDVGDGRLMTYPEYWKEKLNGRNVPLCAVGGPCTSYELVAKDQTEVTFCEFDSAATAFAKRLMQTDYYHISTSTDVIGVESAVALKNSYALGVALTIGLNQARFGIDSEPHFNSQAAAFGQGILEMARLLDYQGAYTTENLSLGAGDLYVTVFGGRTRKIGVLLGRGLDIDEALRELDGVTLESLVVSRRVASAVKTAAKAGKLDLSAFPLLMHIDDIIENKAKVNIPWEKFTKKAP